MENIALIDNLNDHCLKHIFSFLPIKDRLKIGEVCKRWRIIDEQGWNDMKELDVVYVMTRKIHLILKRCGRFLRKLKISDPENYSHCLSMILKFCQLDELIQIEIIGCTLGDRDPELNARNLRQIFENSKKLVHVTFAENKGVCQHDFLNYLNPETLRKLDVASNKEFQINPFQFPNLKDLHLEYIEIIEDKTIRAEVSLKSLEKMELLGCVLPDNFIQRIFTSNNLQDLSLSTMDTINNEDISHLARYNGNIRKMTLLNLCSLTSSCFQYLGKMPALAFLRLDFINGNSHDIAHLTNVKTLIFENIDDPFKDNGLIELIENSSNLERLVFSSSHVSRSLLDDVRQIFQRGQREKYLSFIVKYYACCCEKFDYHVDDWVSDEYCIKDNGCLETINYHPLLDLKVDTEFVNDDPSGSENAE